MIAVLPYVGLAAMLASAYAVAWVAALALPAPPTGGRTGCIDGLRGYLALGVVAHHFLRTWNNARSGTWTEPDGTLLFANLGPTAVMLFFMITALLFYGKIVATGGRLHWRALYVSRLFRLVPAYWVAVAAMATLVAYHTDFTLRVPESRLALSLAQWLAFTLMGGSDINDFADTGGLLAGVIWTLRYEWLFYLGLPLLGLAIAAFGRSRAVRLSVLVGVTLLIGFGPPVTLFHFSLQLALPFLLGMIVSELLSVPALTRHAGGPAGTALGSLALVTQLSLPAGVPLIGQAPLLLVLFTTVAAGNSYFGLLARRPSVVLGDASYSIYLFHGLVLHLAPLCFGAALFTQPSSLGGWMLLPPIATAIVILAILNYRFVEHPFIDAGRALLRVRRDAPVLAKVAP